LTVARGEVFAILGPNGAGKTTTVEILEGFRRRTAGDVRVLGFDPARQDRALKQRVGIVLQSNGVEPYLTVAETIELFRGYYESPLELDHVLGLVGLREQRDQRVRRLSGGQQRRLDVAVGLAGNPELLFLDEPTTGFDPAARRGAWTMVDGLRDLGKTVLLTTHYMDEAESLADRVAIMANGAIVATGRPTDLVGGAHRTMIRFRIPEGVVAPATLGARPDYAGAMVLETATPTAALHALTSWALESGVELDDLGVSRATLEETYLRLTGGEANP
jgi:ABC-2 type transport system ATP-binding protein